MGDPISVLIWGALPYIAKSNYSYCPSLSLDKSPGGVCTSYFINLQFTIDFEHCRNKSLQFNMCSGLFTLLILIIDNNVNVVHA